MKRARGIGVLVLASAAAVLTACGSDPPAAVRSEGSTVTTTTSLPADVADGGDGGYGSSTSTPPAGDASPGARPPATAPRATSPTSPTSPGPGVWVTTSVPGNPSGPTANRVQVVPDAVDLRPRPFESAALIGDRQVAVRFYSGVAPCDVIGRVDVVENAERVTITLYSGHEPSARDRACIELAVYNELVVDLSSPLAGRRITDGAA